jgi:hypothetical protein
MASLESGDKLEIAMSKEEFTLYNREIYAARFAIYMYDRVNPHVQSPNL